MSKISDFVNSVVNDKEKISKSLNIGNTPNFEAQKVAAITGVSIKGLIKILTADGIRHAFNGHGNHALEQKRGQIGITIDCFDYLPEVIANYDYVEEGDPTKKAKSVLFIKRVNIGLLHIVMSCSSENLEFKTIYLKP